MSGMAVLSAPGIPEGWHSREVVRIIDPRGLAVAWIAPGLAGACIALSSRDAAEHPWRTVLVSDVDGGHLGCEVTCTREGNQPVPLRSIASSSKLYERDPTQVIVIVRLPGRDLFVRSRCDEGALKFSWSWSVGDPDPMPMRCLDYRLAHDGNTPVSVSRQMEVNTIDLTIRYGTTAD